MVSTHKESYITSQIFNILCNQDSMYWLALSLPPYTSTNRSPHREYPRKLFVAGGGVEPPTSRLWALQATTALPHNCICTQREIRTPNRELRRLLLFRLSYLGKLYSKEDSNPYFKIRSLAFCPIELLEYIILKGTYSLNVKCGSFSLFS